MSFAEDTEKFERERARFEIMSLLSLCCFETTNKDLETLRGMSMNALKELNCELKKHLEECEKLKKEKEEAETPVFWDYQKLSREHFESLVNKIKAIN